MTTATTNKKINLHEMKEIYVSACDDFRKTIYEIASENKAHKIIMEGLKKQYNEVYEREHTRDELLEVDKPILAEKDRHANALKPLNKKLSDCYDALELGSLYNAYIKQTTGKNEFRKAMCDWLIFLGCEASQKGTDFVVRVIESGTMGKKINSNDNLTNGGTLSTTRSKAPWNKLFMCVFCDLLVEKKVLSNPAADDEEESEE